MRKETQIKVSALCISYFRTVRALLEEEVATLHPKCNLLAHNPPPPRRSLEEEEEKEFIRIQRIL